jgi:hypothetical protein
MRKCLTPGTDLSPLFAVQALANEVSGMAAKSIIRVLLMIAVVGVAFQKHASADALTFTTSFGPTASPFDVTYIFSGFDPTLGSLNMVFLDAEESVTTIGSISNLSQYTGPWGINLSGELTTQFTNSAGSSGISTPTVVPFGNATIPFIDPNTTYLVNVSTSDVNDSVETSAQFFEAGPISANLHAAGGSGISIPDNSVVYSSLLTTLVSGSVSVTYDYTPAPIPEPGSARMTAIGLAGLIAITRKTKRRRSFA